MCTCIWSFGQKVHPDRGLYWYHSRFDGINLTRVDNEVVVQRQFFLFYFNILRFYFIFSPSHFVLLASLHAVILGGFSTEKKELKKEKNPPIFLLHDCYILFHE